MEANITQSRWTDEAIIDLIRRLRNDLIKDFLDERLLKEYVVSQFNVKELSLVKIEFIKRDLKELLIAPVNTSHYETLIHQIKTTDTAALTESNERLFYKELDLLFKRYLF